MYTLICSPLHIATIVHYAAPDSIGNVEQAIQELVRENDKSIHFCCKHYPHHPQMYFYLETEPRQDITPVEILKLIGSYEYRSHSHPGWYTSHAQKITQAIRHYAISKLDGYDEASWTI